MADCAITPIVLLAHFVQPQVLAHECVELLGLPVAPVTLAGYPQLFMTTLLLEMPLYLLALRLTRAASLKRSLVLGVVLNLATHPFVCLLLPRLLKALPGATFAWHLAIAEVFAPVVEGLLLWRLARGGLARSMLIATVCNLASWTIGALLLG